ncbi:hypothetical protein ETAA8_18960 [Anatilimnocola aggregata]|uniref:Uncharacterized protein n=1 Tax=Anatilimnocola aggregata TaxID=2528021 RepID=A0A517Y9A4_9BACT|nr:hypothetical protein [Anatilimnocola aggregata]QDU26813.1 hypothetical protein ETAA8_18960 [Anatilimnocola aggregata]
MSQLTYVLMLHVAVLAVATVAGLLLVMLRNWGENWTMNVRSRVQRRYVKRELSLPQTMAGTATIVKPKRLKSTLVRPLLKTAR